MKRALLSLFLVCLLVGVAQAWTYTANMNAYPDIDGALDIWWCQNYSPGYADSYTDGTTYDPTKSLRFVFPVDDPLCDTSGHPSCMEGGYPAKCWGDFDDSETGTTQEYWVSYYFKFNTSFDWNDLCNKQSYFWASDIDGGYRNNYVINTFKESDGKRYIVMGPQGAGGADALKSNTGYNPEIVRGKWYKLYHHFVANTPGSKNGLGEIWIDELTGAGPKLVMRHDMQILGSDNPGMYEMEIVPVYGCIANSKIEVESYYYVDEVVISSEPLFNVVTQNFNNSPPGFGEIAGIGDGWACYQREWDANFLGIRRDGTTDTPDPPYAYAWVHKSGVTDASDSGLCWYAVNPAEDQLYVQYYFKYDSSWLWHSTLDKHFYMFGTAYDRTAGYEYAADGQYRVIVGNAGSNMRIVWSVQAPGGYYSGNWYLGANTGSNVPIQKGQWYKVNLWADSGTEGQFSPCDGAFKMWVNDTLTHDYSAQCVMWPDDEGWGAVHWAPVWGGNQTQPELYAPNDMWKWFDKITVATVPIPVDPQEPTQDLLAPFTANHSPAKGATGVSATARQITFEVHDDQTYDTGVDTSSIALTVNGTAYDCTDPEMSCTGGDPAVEYVTFTNPTDWTLDSSVSIQINASDVANPTNAMLTDSYSFSIGSWYLVWQDEFDNVACTAGSPCSPLEADPSNDSWMFVMTDAWEDRPCAQLPRPPQCIYVGGAWEDPDYDYGFSQGSLMNAYSDTTKYAQVSDGTLKLRCYADYHAGPPARNYTCASIKTYSSSSSIYETFGKRLFGPYGKMEARMRWTDDQQVLWPSFWGTTFPWDGVWPDGDDAATGMETFGEIDIHERKCSSGDPCSGTSNQYLTNVIDHTYGSSDSVHYSDGVSSPNPATTWYVISMEWFPDRIDFYQNGVLTGSTSIVGDQRYHEPFGLRLKNGLRNYLYPSGTSYVNTSLLPSVVEFDYIRWYTITSPPSGLDITTTSLTNADVNVFYQTTLLTNGGGNAPYTWTLDSGSLPPGMSLLTTGVLSGTPTTIGTYNFTVKVEDSAVSDSDDFNRANETPLAGNWSQVGGSSSPLNLVSNQVSGNAEALNRVAYRNIGSYDGDHWSEIKLKSFGTGTNIGGPMVRVQKNGPLNYEYNVYALTVDNTASLTLWVNYGTGYGTWENLGSKTGLSLVVDDRIKLSATDNTFTVYVNDASQGTIGDPNNRLPSGGAPGFYSRNGAAWDDWSGGDVSGAESDTQALQLIVESPGSQIEETVEITTITDTFINSGSADNNYSSDTALRIYQWPQYTIANRTIIDADISSLPSNAQITNAELRLYVTGYDGYGGTNPMNTYARPITSGYPTIDNVTWNNYAGVHGPLSPATPVPLTTGYVDLDVTNIVQNAHAASADAWIVVDGNLDGTADTNRIFASVDHGTSAYRPRLVVTYYVGGGGNPPPPVIGGPGRVRLKRMKPKYFSVR